MGLVEGEMAMTKKQIRAALKAQDLKPIFDKNWNMVRVVRSDGSVAFDGPEYDLVERLSSGEAL